MRKIILTAIIFVSLVGIASAEDNLILNPSFELITGELPQNWQQNNWGENSADFSLVPGYNSAKAAKVEITQYTSGDAKWFHDDVIVESGKEYTFSDYYISDITSEITLQYLMVDGSYQYVWLGDVPAASDWQNYSTSFMVPQNAVSVTVFHLIFSVGSLTVDNYLLKAVAPPPPPTDDNLIINPSLENGSVNQPDYWTYNSWGENSSVFSYPILGYNSAKAAKVEITQYTSGDAKWIHRDVLIEPNKEYDFSDTYMSNIASNLTLRYLNTDGSYSYFWLGDLPASTSWKNYSARFKTPASAVSVSVFHLIYSVGYLTVDNYNLKPADNNPLPNSFEQGLVSLVFDDAWISQYMTAFPKLQDVGLKGTFYVETVDAFDYQTPLFFHPDDILRMQAEGHEIASHTRNHLHLTQLTQNNLKKEVQGSRQDLINIGAVPINSFSYPYGEYNDNVIKTVQEAGYTSARSVERGFNNKATDKYKLLIQEVNLSTTVNDVKDWIDQANKDKTWLILTFHQIDNEGGAYSTTPGIFQEIINYLLSTNTKVIKVSEGINM